MTLREWNSWGDQSECANCNELFDLRMENAVLKDKLKAALAENTRLAKELNAERHG